MSNTEKPIDTAVALQYDGKQAPTITAKGEEELARQIVEIAEEHGIPLYHDEKLARTLSRMDLGSEIPEELYRTIAEIIAFAYQLQGRVPEGFTPPEQDDL
ncbi:EscU/YscU/HrcU family type III secretion system export apparatus switch protein [Litoribacillus peritrichatus]|uniref:Flagellar biosynthetic protein FlhB n=1 Tax=Litoribacillus peritrichatus TaxID=718191 RepID=A0ABP7M478_9GAMM